MDACLDPNPADRTLRLSRDLYYQIVHELRGALPAPVTDTAEDRARRDNSMIARVASLLPETPDEVILASQYVAASAQALDCLRLLRLHRADAALAMKLSAQSASMMRQSRGARGQLLRVQAERAKREADPAARDKAARVEHAAISVMADALALNPPVPMAAPQPPPLPAPGPDDIPHTLTEAEKYALAHPSRAALIRSLGRLPKKLDGGPMPPGLVHDIVHGASPILQALAKRPNHRLATAA
jgi:hypothetical protein